MSTSSKLTIRRALPADRDQLAALQLRSSLAVDEYRDALLANPDAVELPVEHIVDGGTYVAYCLDELLGFSVTLGRSDGDAELDGLFVDPAAWRRSIGTRLVEVAERHAIEQGAAFLWVTSGKSVEGFYSRCGFERVGETQTRFDSAVVMRKAVGSQPS